MRVIVCMCVCVSHALPPSLSHTHTLTHSPSLSLSPPLSHPPTPCVRETVQIVLPHLLECKRHIAEPGTAFVQLPILARDTEPLRARRGGGEESEHDKRVSTDTRIQAQIHGHGHALAERAVAEVDFVLIKGRRWWQRVTPPQCGRQCLWLQCLRWA